ncbi:MAG: hypothetical protein IJZ74_00260 [Clostridia bacterium]|nr:hypothetical protein [Clostridia bacterium]
MSQTTSQSPREPSRMQDMGAAVRAWCTRMLSTLVHNWSTKLLALILAVGLWAGLITQDPTLTRERHFTDVAVTVTGADTLKRNGYIVTSDLTEALADVNISVDVPQMQYANAQASNYNARIDLTRIRSAGTQEVKIMTTNSSTYGTVSSVTPATVLLEIDEYITRYRIPVSVVMVGEAPVGYYADTPSLDPPTIAISGPKTLVDQIVRAEAVVELANLPTREGTVRKAVPYTLMDENNNVIQSDLLQVTSESVLLDSIIVEQKVYSQRSIDLADMGLVRGTPAAGYEIKAVYITPASVTAAGRKSVLDAINLLYADSYIDVTDQKESVTKSMRIRQPVTLEYVSTNEITVAVEIGPIIQTEAFENIPVQVKNLADGLYAHVDATATSGTVLLSGESLWMNTLYSRSFTLYCDATGLAAGTYELPLLCTIRQSEGRIFTYEIEPETVRVTISDPDAAGLEETPAAPETTPEIPAA